MTPFWQTAFLAQHYSTNVALIEGEREVSYLALHQLVEQRQRELIEKISKDLLHRKSLWLVTANPSIAFVVNYLALLSLGQLIWLTESTKTKNTGSTETSEILAAKNKLTEWQKRYVINFVIDENNQVKRLDTPEASVEHYIFADLALLLSTSGTTGSGKLVKLSYDNLAANCASICQYLPISGEDKTITTLPFHYSFGLSVLHTHLASGSTIVLTQTSVLSPTFWQLIKQHYINCFYGVPYHFQMLMKLNLARIPAKSFKFFAVAGGKLAPEKVLEMATYCEQENKLLFVMYGQTEATARISFLSPEKALEKPDSIGKVIPHGELQLIDENGAPIANSNQVGELVYQGNNVMLGYAESMADLSQGKATSQLFTGDLAYKDEAGDFFITGRLKRILKIAGLRISLDEVESTIRTWGYEAAALGEDDRLVCIVEKADIKTTEMITRKLAQNLGFTAHFIEVNSIETLPRMTTGKLDYATLAPELDLSNSRIKASYQQQGKVD